MTTVPSILAAAMLLCVAAAAVCDVARFEIPDTLSVVILALGLGYGAFHPGFAWLMHLGAPVAVFAFGLLAFSRGWLGGGDVKVLSATAVWTGFAGLPVQWVVMALAGGAMTLLLLAARAALRNADPAGLPQVFQRDAPLPYAVPIAIGTGWWAWLALPLGQSV